MSVCSSLVCSLSLASVGPPNPWTSNDTLSSSTMLEAISKLVAIGLHSQLLPPSSLHPPPSSSSLHPPPSSLPPPPSPRLLQCPPTLHKALAVPPTLGRSATHTLLDGLQKIHALPYQLHVEGSREGIWLLSTYCTPTTAVLVSDCTMEPLNNGHIGMDHFVHHREVVLFRKQKYTV